MKKQLNKIKIAAENFSRSNKADKSNDDLQKADKQVEKFKDVLERVSKKFSANPPSTFAQFSNQDQESAAREKRIKKVHEHRLGVAMEECLKDLPESLLREVLENCARLEKTIASEIICNEMNVENDVTKRLTQIMETHLSTIQKQKRIVTKLQQDSDSARHKYLTALRTNDSLTKTSQLKEELDECESKLEKERDLWASEMFELIAEEESIASNILNYVKYQQLYYRTALVEIEQVLNQMNGCFKESNKRVFKTPLADHLSSSGRTISSVIELCVCCLLEKGMLEEGLLRVGCAGSKLRRMKSALDANLIGTPLPPEYQDVHVIASVLKAYLRDLPDPLLTFKLYEDFVSAAQKPIEVQRKSAILNAINQLPEGNYFNLRYLTKFLSLLSSRHDRNKMSSQNIAIVMSPNLLWPQNQVDSDYAQKVSSTTAVNTIVEMLVADWDFFFDGEVDFYITMSRDDLFPDNGGFPLEMSQSMVINSHNGGGGGGGTGPSPGVSYMQPMSMTYTNNTSNMTQSMGPGRHSRSSSHDASQILTDVQMKHSQSNSSLSDHSSPPQTDSPKLPVRRKHNKQAAPTPPDSSLQNKLKKSIEHLDGQMGKVNLQERLLAAAASDTAKPEKPPRPVMSAECQTLNRLAYKTAKSSMGSTPKPVALPRTTILASESLSRSREGLKSSEDEDDSKVIVREKEERLGNEKPAIPERPASLMRPNLFKGSLQEVNQPCPTDSPSSTGVKKTQSFRTNSTGGLNNKEISNNGHTVLERTHIYNVDKQQVSFIDVDANGPKRETAPLAEMESNAVITPPGEFPTDFIAQVPPSPRSLVMDVKMIKRPQVPAPPPPANRPKSQESLGDTEVTGL